MKRKYCDIYDAFYGRFGKWLEGKYGDSNCEFCFNRPRRHHYFCKCKKLDKHWYD